MVVYLVWQLYCRIELQLNIIEQSKIYSFCFWKGTLTCCNSTHLDPGKTITVTWNSWIWKFWNSNIGKCPGRLSDIVFFATVGWFVAHSYVRRFFFLLIISGKVSWVKLLSYMSGCCILEFWRLRQFGLPVTWFVENKLRWSQIETCCWSYFCSVVKCGPA